MNCENCTNKTYCAPFRDIEDLRGCGSGIPEFHPSAIAEKVVRKVNRGIEEMNLDRTKYSREVMKEIKKALSKNG